jgi:hypothetical protein
MTTENTTWNRDIRFTLTGGGNTIILKESPMGWDDDLIKWDRSDKYYGLFRSYSQNLTFVKSGASFLRRMFYSITGRSGAECTITVEKFDRLLMIYDTVFTGDVDFMTFDDAIEGVKVTVVDNGISKWIKLNEDTEYSIDMDSTFQHNFEGILYSNYDYETYYTLMLTLLDKMTEGRITSGVFAMDSTFLSAIGDYGGLTTGKGVRDPLGGTNTIKLKFSDFASDLSKLYFCGYYTKYVNGIDTFFTVSMDDIFLSSTEMYDLGDVSNFRLKVKENLLFNKISVGYETKTYEDSTVKNETNSESIFVTSMSGTNDTFDLKCKYRGDIAGLKQIYNAGSGDETLDNDIWHLTLEPGGVGTPQKTITGRLRKGTAIQAIDCWNHNISPARILIKWQKYIDSCLDGEQGMGVSFQSWGTENNLNQTTNLTYSEPWIAENYPYVSSTNRLFLPYIFTFKAPAGFDFFDKMKINPLGYISFTWNRHDYKGFLLSGTVSIAKETIVEFQLLSHPSNDLTNLIRR